MFVYKQQVKSHCVLLVAVVLSLRLSPEPPHPGKHKNQRRQCSTQLVKLCSAVNTQVDKGDVSSDKMRSSQANFFLWEKPLTL